MRKFLIFSPPYNEISGGIVCLHKLCSMINEAGGEAYLFPCFENLEISKANIIRPALKLVRDYIRSFMPYRQNDSFNTRYMARIPSTMDWDDWIVIYFEQVFGNPLGAKNVVRWLLHTPGFHTGSVYYGPNELYIKFNNAVRDFSFPGSTVSQQELKVIHYPLEYYNQVDAKSERSGSAYCIRKGKRKIIQHDLSNSILIDGKSHKEVSEIFKRVKTFISYDSYTAYSLFAVLCGCESVVIPDDGVDEKTWYPDPSDRYGIAYGFENLPKALQTRHLVYDRIVSEHQDSFEDVQNFIQNAESFFDLPKATYQK